LAHGYLKELIAYLGLKRKTNVESKTHVHSDAFQLRVPEFLKDQLSESQIQEILQIEANPHTETQMPNWHRQNFKGITRVLDPMDLETRESRVNG
jgi:hypothetical protein